MTNILEMPTGPFGLGDHGRTPATSDALRAHLPPEVFASVQYQRTREMSIDELLLENRVVFLIGAINYSTAARVMMQMLYLENQKRGQNINFYINSPGGAVDDTLDV
jgi:ATP-dependent Clp protease protease subunit